MTTTAMVRKDPDEPPETAPATVSTPANLWGAATPGEVVGRAAEIAHVLAGVIERQQLYVSIQGRKYVRVEGWTLLGTLLGVYPVTVWCRRVDAPSGWEARVEARTLAGALVGAAEAQCTRDEPAWRDRPDFALRSMAQTRATSKALRLPLGFVAALAGYEATPAEEVEGVIAPAPQAPQAAARPGGQQPALDGGTATEAQLRKAWVLAKTAGFDEAAFKQLVRDRYGHDSVRAISKQQASDLIDWLQELTAEQR